MEDIIGFVDMLPNVRLPMYDFYGYLSQNEWERYHLKLYLGVFLEFNLL